MAFYKKHQGAHARGLVKHDGFELVCLGTLVFYDASPSGYEVNIVKIDDKQPFSIIAFAESNATLQKLEVFDGFH